MSAIDVRGLAYAYRIKSSRGWRRRHDLHWALKDISFHVDPEEAIGIVGSNGSGKTTLLQCLAGVLHPTSGRVVVSGRVSALVHLFAGFHRELTGRENLFVVGVLNGLTRQEVRDVTDEIIAFSGLDDEALDSPFRTYSAGMGIRLGFSVVAHTRPDVLLVDEVLAVGDEAFRLRCIERVRELRAGGCAVVVVSHDLDLITAQCTRAIWLDNGSIVRTGSVDEVLTEYRHVAEPTGVDERHIALNPIQERRLRRQRRRV
jgi:lipopolysaccharide transport system ATP-binding protein